MSKAEGLREWIKGTSLAENGDHSLKTKNKAADQRRREPDSRAKWNLREEFRVK